MDAKRLIKGTPEFNVAYAKAVEWWTAWKFPVIPVESLPTSMFAAYNESGPVSVGFLYVTDSPLAMLEWIVADPKAEKASRARAIELVITSAKVYAEASGVKMIFTFVRNQSLMHKLEKKGFLKTDEGMTHYLWRG